MRLVNDLKQSHLYILQYLEMFEDVMLKDVTLGDVYSLEA